MRGMRRGVEQEHGRQYVSPSERLRASLASWPGGQRSKHPGRQGRADCWQGGGSRILKGPRGSTALTGAAHEGRTSGTCTVRTGWAVTLLL